MRVASSPSRCTSTCVCFACELGLPSPPTTGNPSPPPLVKIHAPTCTPSARHTAPRAAPRQPFLLPRVPHARALALSASSSIAVLRADFGACVPRPRACCASLSCSASRLRLMSSASLRPPLGRAVRRPPASRRRTTRSLRSTWHATKSGPKARPRWPGRWRSAACSREQR